MIPIRIAGSLGLLLATVLTTSAQPPGDDEKAIRAVLDAQVAAWNKGDLDTFMLGYWKDDKLTFISGGTIVKGYKALQERYQKSYQAEGKEMGKLAFSELEFEPLGPAAAMVRGKFEVKMSKDTATGRFTLIFRKPDGKWVVTHDHTSGDPPKKQ